jgi:hypothetical protein
MRAAEGSADAVGEFGRGEQAVGLPHLALAVEPRGLMTPILEHLLSSNMDK